MTDAVMDSPIRCDELLPADNRRTVDTEEPGATTFTQSRNRRTEDVARRDSPSEEVVARLTSVAHLDEENAKSVRLNFPQERDRPTSKKITDPEWRRENCGWCPRERLDPSHRWYEPFCRHYLLCICGTAFRTQGVRKSYCSDACRKKADTLSPAFRERQLRRAEARRVVREGKLAVAVPVIQ